MPQDDPALYTLKQANALTGVSRQGIRQYCARYARWLSTYATPPPGIERQFTRDDLRVFRFIREITATGANHETVIERLSSGGLADFTWEPQETPQSAPGTPTEPSTYLVPVERLQAAQTLLEDAQRREQAAQERAETLQAEVQRLTFALGEAEGKLKAHYKAPRWWRALFGGAAGE
jgi:DNA-binding transcriptional MerR regulator